MADLYYHGRGFLNSDAGMAAFEAEVDTRYSHHGSLDATFDISDCRKKISLDFSIDEFRTLESRIHKVDTLIGELVKFREALESAHKWVNKPSEVEDGNS